MEGVSNLFYEGLCEAPVGSAPFNPLALDGLVLFLDSRNVTSSPVSTWPDSSSNNFDGVQSDAARQPVTGSATSPNGSQLVSFDGSAVPGQEDGLDIIITVAEFPTVANGYTFYLVGNLKTCQRAAAVNSSIWFSGPTANHPEHTYEDKNFTHKYSIDDSATDKTFTAFSSGDQRLCYVWSVGAGGPVYTGAVELFRSGVSQGTVLYSLNTAGISNVRLGDANPYGQSCFMDVALVAWYARAHDAATRAQMDQWIADNFGY